MAAVLFVLYLPVEEIVSHSSVSSSIVHQKHVTPEDSLPESKGDPGFGAVTEENNDESEKNTVLDRDDTGRLTVTSGTVSDTDSHNVEPDCVTVSPVSSKLAARKEEKPLRDLSSASASAAEEKAFDKPELSIVLPPASPGTGSNHSSGQAQVQDPVEPGDSTTNTDNKTLNKTGKSRNKEVNFTFTDSTDGDAKEMEELQEAEQCRGWERHVRKDGKSPAGPRKYDTECVTLLEVICCDSSFYCFHSFEYTDNIY